MSSQLFMRFWVSSLILTNLWIGPVASDTPVDKSVSDPTNGLVRPRTCEFPVADQEVGAPKEDLAACDDADPATNDKCVAGICVNEPVVTCRCADDYANAVSAFNAQPGGRLAAWDVCDDAKFHKVGINARSKKVAQMPGGQRQDFHMARLGAQPLAMVLPWDVQGDHPQRQNNLRGGRLAGRPPYSRRSCYVRSIDPRDRSLPGVNPVNSQLADRVRRCRTATNTSDQRYDLDAMTKPRLKAGVLEKW